MLIGIPAETLAEEKRVATVPDVVEKIVKLGFGVAIQSGAGDAAHRRGREGEHDQQCQQGGIRRGRGELGRRSRGQEGMPRARGQPNPIAAGHRCS